MAFIEVMKAKLKQKSGEKDLHQIYKTQAHTENQKKSLIQKEMKDS